jgi:hypothetical protein
MPTLFAEAPRRVVEVNNRHEKIMDTFKRLKKQKTLSRERVLQLLLKFWREERREADKEDT